MSDVDEPTAVPLHGVLAEFSRLLVDRYDVTDVLYWLVGVAVETTDATGAGILLEDVDARLRYAVASDPMTSRLEAIQLELGEGPCMLAHATGEAVAVHDLAGESRFAGFVERARSVGAAAVLTLPLLHAGSSIGILDLYRTRPGPFAPDTEPHGRLLADMATTAVLNRRAYDDSVSVSRRLQAALDARIVMEQAKGRIGEQRGVDMQRAEQLIHDYAKQGERPIGEVVREIAEGRLAIEGANA